MKALLQLFTRRTGADTLAAQARHPAVDQRSEAGRFDLWETPLTRRHCDARKVSTTRIRLRRRFLARLGQMTDEGRIEHIRIKNGNRWQLPDGA
jgi:hypothetical protein